MFLLLKQLNSVKHFSTTDPVLMWNAPLKREEALLELPMAAEINSIMDQLQGE